MACPHGTESRSRSASDNLKLVSSNSALCLPHRIMSTLSLYFQKACPNIPINMTALGVNPTYSTYKVGVEHNHLHHLCLPSLTLALKAQLLKPDSTLSHAPTEPVPSPHVYVASYPPPLRILSNPRSIPLSTHLLHPHFPGQSHQQPRGHGQRLTRHPTLHRVCTRCLR